MDKNELSIFLFRIAQTPKIKSYLKNLSIMKNHTEKSRIWIYMSYLNQTRWKRDLCAYILGNIKFMYPSSAIWVYSMNDNFLVN